MKKIHDARRAAKRCINEPKTGKKHGRIHKAGRCRVCYRALLVTQRAYDTAKRAEARRLRLAAKAPANTNTNGAIAPQLTLDLPPREQTQLDCDTPPALSEPVERTGDP